MEYYKNLGLEDLFYINDDGLVCCEEWRDVVGYKGRYMVSNLGRVKTLNYNKTKIAGILKQRANNEGYLTLCLYRTSCKNTRTVHPIVAKAFILNKNKKPIVNHKSTDGDKTNNISVNLEWSTYSENNLHAYKNNLSNAAKGECYKSKLTEKQVIEIRNTKKPFTHKELACIYNITRVTISDILRRKSWKHI